MMLPLLVPILKRRVAPLLLGAAALLSFNPNARAANDAWSTAPGSNAFTGLNWTPGATTGGTASATITAGDNLYFSTSSVTTLNENETAGFNIGGFTFNSGASAYTI